MLPNEYLPLVAALCLASVTTIVVLIGIQFYHVMAEFRKSVIKVNKMLDDAGRVSGTVSTSVENLSSFAGGLSAGMKAIASVLGKKGE